MNNETTHSGADDMLDSLWQEQSALNIDTNEVIRKAKSQQNKQRLYIALDLLSLVPFVLVLILIDEKAYAGPIIPFFWLNLIGSIVMVSYFIKLRWVSAFSSSKSTQDYTQNLLTQLKNNAVIARINKHMAWIASLLVIGFFMVDAYMRNDSIEQLSSMFMRLTLLAMILLTPWFFWCKSRQNRFNNEAKELKRMMEG